MTYHFLRWNCWNDALRGWHSHLAAGGRAPATIELRLRHVVTVAKRVGRALKDVNVEHLELVLANGEWSPAYRRGIRASIRLFFAWSYRHGHIDDDPAAELPSIKQPRAIPRPVSEQDTARALAYPDDRTALMVALMAQCGLRRGEVATVRGGDVISGIHGPLLRVCGKGGHVREVPLPPYLAKSIRDRGEGWLFPGAINGHLSPRRVGELVRDALPPGMTSHQLRHRYGTVTYQRSHDIRAVQILLGHAKLDTTMVYTAVDSADTARAAATAWRAG